MEKGFYDFGTMNYIRIESRIPEREQQEILDDMKRRCDDIDDLLSAFKPDSDIGRINTNAGIAAVSINAVTLRLLERALYFAEITQGSFDPTIRPAVEMWKIGSALQRIPSEQECRSAAELVDYRCLHLNIEERTAYLEKKQQSIDLGGIAKGFAGDVIRKELIYRGVDSALINFGGTVLTIGRKSDGSDWKAGIQDPVSVRGKIAGSIILNDAALVTSGVNERFFIHEGKLFHHLLDPRTCRPAESGILSVTAAGACAEDLDAVTTALFIAGAKNGISMAERLGFEVLFINDVGNITATKEFADGRFCFTINKRPENSGRNIQPQI